MRIGLTLDYANGFKRSADAVPELEDAGLDIIFVAEAYGSDAPSQMGYLAARTNRVRIASGIIPVFSRSPALIAQTAAGVDALSGGRTILGLGASGAQVIEGWHGVPFSKPVERLQQTIEVCRQAWRREVVTSAGPHPIPLPPAGGTGLGKPLKILAQPVRQAIPIWIASLGARSVKMTAQLADGWLPTLFIPERARRIWGDPLAAGTARRATGLSTIDIATAVSVAIGDRLDVEALRDAQRASLALYIGGMGARNRNYYNEVVKRYGYEREASTIRDLYLDGKREAAMAAVPAKLIEELSLIGPVGYVRDRLAAYREAGVTVLIVNPVGGNGVDTIRALKEVLR